MLTGSGGMLDVTGGAAGQAGVGGSGGAGRIRLEAAQNTLAVDVSGVTPSVDVASSVILPTAPTLAIIAVAGVAVPATPGASYATPDVVLPATTANPVSIALAAANIPPGTTVSVQVTPRVGAASTATSAALEGSLATSTATATVTLPTTQPAIVSATATFVLSAAAAGGPVVVQGETVERVRVTTTPGGGSVVAYLTRTGREIVLPAR